MPKRFENRKPTDVEKAALTKKCARLVGVTVRQVKRVMSGEQKNDVIITTFMRLDEMTNIAEKVISQDLQTAVA